MNFSRRVKIVLWISLIILNILFRYPLTLHEIGDDSFAIHGLANSLSELGHAKWWIHPLSIFGLYPNSYPSAVPFILSSLAQVSEIDMEWVIWLFSIFLGVLSGFSAYLLAGEIKNNDVFKFLVAFGFSTSTGILYFTTWTASSRGLFVVLLPLLLYVLLKARGLKLRYFILLLALFLMAVATHRMFYFIVPVVISSLVALYFSRSNRAINKIILFSIILIFGSLALLPVLSGSQLIPLQGFDLIKLTISTYARHIGIMVVFGILGLLLKINRNVLGRNFNELFLLFALISLAPFFFIYDYTPTFIIPFMFLLIGIGLINLFEFLNNKKLFYPVIFIILLLSISFSAFFQAWTTNIFSRPYFDERYLEESTYSSAIWAKDYINEPIVGNDLPLARRIFAISQGRVLTATDFTDLVNGFVDINTTKGELKSPSEISFFRGSPIKESTSDTSWYWYELMTLRRDTPEGNKIISKFNLSYAVENNNIWGNYTTTGGASYSQFYNSIHETDQKVYDNGKVSFWSLRFIKPKS